MVGPGPQARRSAQGRGVRGLQPLTPEELAEIREAAADELLAVEAATTGRRGPGQPGSARVFPGESSSPAAAFGPGLPLDVLPGCAQLAVSADAAADDDRFDGVPEGELVGLLCAWDRVEAHAAARKLAVIAELGRRNPKPGGRGIHRGRAGERASESPGPGLCPDWARLSIWTPICPAPARRCCDGTISLSKAQIIVNATGPARTDRGPRRRGQGSGPGRSADPRRAARRHRPRRHRSRPEEGEGTPRDRRRSSRGWSGGREDSGNAALAGRELPPDEILAADERITWLGRRTA